jgi:hypothetical protein
VSIRRQLTGSSIGSLVVLIKAHLKVALKLAVDDLVGGVLRGTVATEQSHAAAQNLAEAVRSGNYS